VLQSFTRDGVPGQCHVMDAVTDPRPRGFAKDFPITIAEFHAPVIQIDAIRCAGPGQPGFLPEIERPGRWRPRERALLSAGNVRARHRLRIPPAVVIVTLMIQPSQPAAARFLAGFGAVVRPRTGMGRIARGMLRGALFVGAGGLIAFHGWLLWDRLSGGALLHPTVALRWAAAALLVGALAGLRHLGAPLFQGRRALVVWLLVALLHWNAGAAVPADGAATSPSPSTVMFVLPTTAAAALVGLSLLAAALSARRRTAPGFACLRVVEPVPVPPLSTGWRRGGLGRAPPPACA
jgi:hypothetical protein